MVLEASSGDYRFLLQRKSDGTFICYRILIGETIHDPANVEEFSDWAQLPSMIRQIFIHSIRSIATTPREPQSSLQSELKV